MGNFIQDTIDTIRGKTGARAAEDAARIQAQNYQKGLDEMRRQFDIGRRGLDPYMQAGQQGLPLLQQGASVQGYSDLLAEIMQSGMFDELVDERMRGAQGMLGAGGLTRSGAAMEEGERIPVDIATTLAGILTGNAGNLANMGQASAAGAANLGANFGANAMNAQGQIGNALASGPLGAAQANQQGFTNILSAGLGLFGPKGIWPQG